jgi:hypothetical protein
MGMFSYIKEHFRTIKNKKKGTIKKVRVKSSYKPKKIGTKKKKK